MATTNQAFKVKYGITVEGTGAGQIKFTATEFLTAGILTNNSSGVIGTTVTPTGLTSINGITISGSSGTFLVSGNIGTSVQAYDADLTSIAALTGDGLIRKTAGVWGMDSTVYLTSAVTSVGATAPVASSGGNTPTISLNSGYGDTLNPYASKTANYVLAAPNGSAGVPSFRALVTADLPAAPSVTNSLILKADTGTTEGTDLYTFNGSAAKTLNIVGGTNITIAKVAGQWTINGAASGVTTLSFGTTGLTPNSATSGAITVAGTLVAANGGTGQSVYAVGDILYASTTTALSKLTVGTSSQVLIGGTTPAWGAVALGGTMVSGTLLVGNGGTGTTTGSITGTGALTFTAGGTNTNVNLVPNGTGTVDVASKKITNVATPTVGTDAANKQYVDDARTGLDAKASVRAASTATVTVTYNATGGTSARGQITAAPNTLDGVTLAANDRILLKDQSTGAQNGIWVVSTLGTGANGVWDRATDFDSDAEVTAGAYVWVEEGTANLDSAWVLTTSNPIIVGGASGTALTWVLFSSAGSLIAGAGMTKTGNALDVVTASSARIVVNADNIDLATVSQSNTTAGPTGSFVSSVTVDSYGRVTGQNTTSHTLATTAVAGIASFSSSQFTVTTGAVSLTSLAGSVINSGVVGATYGGTGVNNGSNTITLAGNISTAGAFTTAGAFGLTLTTTALTNATIPSGTVTLVDLASAQSLTNKKLGSLTTNGFVTTSGSDGTLSVTVPGTGVSTFITTPSAANFASTLAAGDKTGTGKVVFDASPTLTGTPLAPTAVVGTNTTQIATTAYVKAEIAATTGTVSGTASITGNTPTVISGVGFATGTYSSAEYIVKTNYTTNSEISKILLTIDYPAAGAQPNVYLTEYSNIQTGGTSIAAITATVTGSTSNWTVNLQVTPVASSGTTTVKVIGTLLAS